MNRIWIALLIVIVAGIGIWYFGFNRKSTKEDVPKDNPIAVSQHSDSFNTAMNKMLDDYTAMTESFVNWDSVAIDQHAAALQQSLSNINFHELKDSTIFQTASSYRDNFKNDLNTIQEATDLTKKRQALNSFSQNLYDLLRIVRYDRGKVYLQECPMAFNDNDPGLWLSRSQDIRNPYLGLHHPKYGKAMIECGDNKDSLNYAALATP